MLDRIEDELQLQLSFPAPFAGERGIESSRGLIAYRAVDALYQAWRVAQLLPGAGRVVEIGAGLGRTAYYARLFGIDDYTLVVVPLILGNGKPLFNDVHKTNLALREAKSFRNGIVVLHYAP